MRAGYKSHLRNLWTTAGNTLCKVKRLFSNLTLATIILDEAIADRVED